MGIIRTDDILAQHHLAELFRTSDDEYDSPDLDETDTVQVCDGVWQRDGEFWRFWRYDSEE